MSLAGGHDLDQAEFYGFKPEGNAWPSARIGICVELARGRWSMDHRIQECFLNPKNIIYVIYVTQYI